MSSTPRKRILFVAEGVTLAHVTRPLALARTLNTNGFELHFGCTPAYEAMLAGLSARYWPITSISSTQFLDSLSAGRPVYDRATLRSYVKEDLDLLEQVQPDLVIGDFRLSLCVSATHYGVPYASITNAYWSEYYGINLYPVPELPITRILGVSLTSAIFHCIQPFVFAHHAHPLNQVRREFGMPPLANLMQTYTSSDYVLYADIPALFPMSFIPDNHHYLGPIFWAPNMELPDWWSGLATAKPLVYINLGSSGPVHILPRVIEALTALPVTAVLATAGRWESTTRASNIWVADFLPGDKVAKQADLIICNGGSPSVYQALHEGVPVVGIPSNMDQHLMMQAIVREGAGLLVRSEFASRKNLQDTIMEVLQTSSYRERAHRFQNEIAQYSATTKFPTVVDKMTSGPPEKSIDATT